MYKVDAVKSTIYKSKWEGGRNNELMSGGELPCVGAGESHFFTFFMQKVRFSLPLPALKSPPPQVNFSSSPSPS